MALDQVVGLDEPADNYLNYYSVVQLYFEDKPYLLVGGFDSSGHSIVLSDWLKSSGVSKNYRVCGAGIANVDNEEKYVRFFGESKGWGIGIDKEHLMKIRELLPDWKLDF